MIISCVFDFLCAAYVIFLLECLAKFARVCVQLRGNIDPGVVLSSDRCIIADLNLNVCPQVVDLCNNLTDWPSMTADIGEKKRNNININV